MSSRLDPSACITEDRFLAPTAQVPFDRDHLLQTAGEARPLPGRHSSFEQTVLCLQFLLFTDTLSTVTDSVG